MTGDTDATGLRLTGADPAESPGAPGPALTGPEFTGPGFTGPGSIAPGYAGAGAAGEVRGAIPAPAGEIVTCPECGQVATVEMARRQADDFCTNCDFPLFWARGRVIAADGDESGASLRRLPGTVGRAATAALICPHCSEPNPPAGEICIRCSLSLHPVEIPEPEPVFVPLPPPPAPLPERTFDWWWVVALVTVMVAIAAVVTLISLR